MKQNRLLEKFAKYLWPLVRVFVPRARRCSRCILSERYTTLIDGICLQCTNLESKDSSVPIVKNDLDQVFRQTIFSYQDDRKHHALLMLSGGKDSAYILARLRNEFPALRILCVFVNNGFSSDVALRGATHVAEKTKTDLYVLNSAVDKFAHVFRSAFLSLNSDKGYRGSYGVVDYADGNTIYEISRDLALQLKIPVIFSGLSLVQVKLIVGSDSFLDQKLGEPTVLFPLAVWRTNEQEIRKQVRRQKLLPPGNDSPIVSNNTLIVTMSAIDVLNLGYCSFEPEFAQLIREGKADRKTWLYTFELLEFAVTRGLLDREIEANLKVLNLSLQDVMKNSDGKSVF